MYLKQKYVRTRNNVIIVFPELITHDQFSDFNPISAGFISFVVSNNEGGIEAICHGKSVSLGIGAAPGDSELASRQLFNKGIF